MDEIEKTNKDVKKCSPAKRVYKWIDYNRFVVIGPVLGLAIWFYALSCTPQTVSPIDPTRLVTESELVIDFKVWQSSQDITSARFEAAGQDLQKQKENNAKLQTMILNLASGSVADMPGLIKLILAGGGIGALGDNIRKRGLIAGLKKNGKA